MPSSERGPRPLLNVLSNWGTFVVFAVVNVFLSPYIVHQLGNSLYGIWAIVGSIVGYLGLLDLGVRGAVTRYMARFAAMDDVESANRLASSGLVLFAVASLVAMVLTAGFAAAAPAVFRIEPQHVGQTRVAVLASGATIAASLLSGVFGGTLAGLHRWTQLNVLEIGLEGLRVAGILAALSRGGGIVALALIHLVLGLLRLGMLVVLSHRAFPRLRVRVGTVDRTTVRLIMSFGAHAMLLNASGMLILYSDSIVIGALLPVSAVTFFAIGANLIEYTRRILSGISYTLTPLVSATDAVSHPQAVGLLLRRSARLGTLIIAPILVIFLLRGGAFIGLWMGPPYREASGAVLQILTTSAFFSASYQMLTVTLLGLSRHQVMVPIFIAEALMNLLLSLVLARPYGVAGVAIGTTLPRLVVALGYGPRIARREFGIAPALFARDSWLRPALAMVPFALISFAFQQLWRPDSLATFFLQVALSLPLAAMGTWYLALDEDERLWGRQRLQRLLGRVHRGTW